MRSIESIAIFSNGVVGVSADDPADTDRSLPITSASIAVVDIVRPDQLYMPGAWENATAASGALNHFIDQLTPEGR